MKHALICSALATMLAGLTGCSLTCKQDPAPVVSTPVPAAAAYYAEEEHDGRIYVLGNVETHATFKELHHLPYTKTVIGGGPKGETVVVEVDKSNPDLQDELWNAFQAKHLFYAEEEHDGRIYVLGNAETHAKFKELHHLPYTHTRIGAGPEGKTLVFEVDKSNPALQHRLIRTFAGKHNLHL